MENWITYLLLIGVVLSGGLLVFFLKEKITGSLKFLLAFSGAFMLGIAALHLIPEVYAEHQTYIGIYVLLGFLIQLILEYFSQGIEHGHIHAHKNASSKFFAPILISLCIHAFLEGLPLANESLGHNHSHGFVHSDEHSFLISILLHKFPIAITLMTLFVKSNVKMKKAFFLLIIFSLMAPLGNFVAVYYMDFFQENGNIMNKILAIVVGMFLHISTTILFETDESHKFNLAKLLLIISGGYVAYLVA
ncbi:ZIP family metal transporter [Flavobacteriales bacterium]|jgi:zinc transporter ZupT|nr:ZIP family metal transporter [Flavobacteriales bacterium]MDG1176187.1 ZIP family metal transporter [Flavobacteriales bacterium]|tara:strand:+ start:2472 stop:3215 length:744 start_codon:yes stop_codon:yes gene_type:complete